MMRWHHEVSTEWLEARRDVLTATEVKRLLPDLKRREKDPSHMPMSFAQLWCEKSTLTEPDPESWGPAARGHIMEPWAVADWNRQEDHGPDMHHWDDCVIKSAGLGFSPDALDIPQLTHDVELRVSVDGRCLESSDGYKCEAPRHMMEVKSYEPAAHIKAVMTPKDKLAERMQIAMAFKVLPYLETGRLLWYCPGAPISMWTVEFKRADLVPELRAIESTMAVWDEVRKTLSKARSKWSTDVTEQEVWEDWQMQEALDRDGDAVSRIR